MRVGCSYVLKGCVLYISCYKQHNIALVPIQITIFTTATAEPQYNSNKTWLSNDLLNVFSQHNWSSVCLAHLFTAEKFIDGLLGVAFIGNSNPRTTGGICSKSRPV